MKRNILLVVCLVLASFTTRVEAQTPKHYDANWESIATHPYPKWFSEAKLGIFIHWGVYSVPSWSGKEQYAEWFLRGLQLNDTALVNYQKQNYGEDFTYRDYAPLLKAELFDASEWADLFKKSGAKYVTFTTKHHDGYCLYPSKYAPNWNSMEVGPKRDIVGELSTAVKETGLKMGLYYSLTEWNNPLHRWYTDPHENIGKYVDEHMVPQFKEMVGKYKPSLIFSDGEWFNKADEFKASDLISWYYNQVGDEAIVNNRWGAGSSHIGFLTPEYSSGLVETDRPWTEVRGLGRSFALNRNETIDSYMTSSDLVHLLVKSVARGGGLMINIGPGADGQIPLLQQERLLDLGKWLDVNGEAIYGSSAWGKLTEKKEVTLKRVEESIDFNWVRNSPGKPIVEDKFSAVWSGYIEAPHSGKFAIEAAVDDGVRLWIDNKLILDKWDPSADKEANGNVMSNLDYTIEKGEVRLKSGKKHSIKMEYYEATGNAKAQLYWSSNQIEREIVPQANLFTSKEVANGNGLSAVYSSDAIWLCYTQKEDNVYVTMLDWPGKELVLDFAEQQEAFTVSMLGLEGDLDYTHENGKLRIDLSEIYHNNLPCEHAWTIKISGVKN